MEMEKRENPPYNALKDRVKEFQEFFSSRKQNFDPFQITQDEFESLKGKIITKSQTLITSEPDSPLNPDLEGLKKHLVCMEKVFSWLFSYDSFRKLLPKEARNNFNFLRFLILTHDLERFFFNGSLPINYVDQVGDALVAKEAFSSFPFDNFLHSIDYITERKKAPEPEINPLPYIFKTVDSLAKPSRDPEKFLNSDYDQWLERQISMGKFPIRIKKYNGQLVEVSSEEYKQRDIGMINTGIEILASKVGIDRQTFFSKIREINFGQNERQSFDHNDSFIL